MMAAKQLPLGIRDWLSVAGLVVLLASLYGRRGCAWFSLTPHTAASHLYSHLYTSIFTPIWAQGLQRRTPPHRALAWPTQCATPCRAAAQGPSPHMPCLFHSQGGHVLICRWCAYLSGSLVCVVTATAGPHVVCTAPAVTRRTRLRTWCRRGWWWSSPQKARGRVVGIMMG